MKFCDWHPEYADWEWLRNLCPPGQYCKVESDKFARQNPSGLQAKLLESVVMTADSGATSVVCVNHFRLDRNEVDQHPWVGVFDHKNKMATGGFLEHGNWKGRTQELTVKYGKDVAASGIANYVSYDVPASSGFLTDLKGSSNLDALQTSLEVKKRKEQGDCNS